MFYQFNPEIVPTAQQAFVRQLLDCKNFSTSERLQGSSKGRGITWFLHTEDKLGVDAVHRHYYRGGLFGKLIRDRYWFNGYANTRAAKEFALLCQLHQWGLPVPQPIAFKIQHRCGCYQADILLQKIANTHDLSQLLQTAPLAEQQYHHIGKLIRRLHDHQVHHSDLNIHNILLDDQGKFWLIDFDKCRIEQGEQWKAANLARLLRSFRKEQKRLAIHFSAANWQALLAGYHA